MEARSPVSRRRRESWYCCAGLDPRSPALRIPVVDEDGGAPGHPQSAALGALGRRLDESERELAAARREIADLRAALALDARDGAPRAVATPVARSKAPEALAVRGRLLADEPAEGDDDHDSLHDSDSSDWEGGE